MSEAVSDDENIKSANKPIHDFHVLMDTLYPHAKPVACAKNKRLEFTRTRPQSCYLLYEGFGLVHRASDGLVLGTIKAPYIIGITNLFTSLEEQYYWRAGKTCSILVVESAVVREVIEKNHLWENFARVLSYIVQYLSGHSERLVAQNGYHLVCHQLISLMNEPEFVRAKMSPSKYIIDRTLLSRSYVMKILSELKQSGRIIVSDKMLVEVKDLFKE
ncbi:helix-turn-helix domain-containing protein [Scandinavium sp. NPDC088450]|uniref:helix-turn-helix domain-containing protein n=1 Tax=Scandinavium sp. NPDC088450 TaxID=3364514 RepID=UPI00384D2252